MHRRWRLRHKKDSDFNHGRINFGDLIRRSNAMMPESIFLSLEKTLGPVPMLVLIGYIFLLEDQPCQVFQCAYLM